MLRLRDEVKKQRKENWANFLLAFTRLSDTSLLMWMFIVIMPLMLGGLFLGIGIFARFDEHFKNDDLFFSNLFIGMGVVIMAIGFVFLVIGMYAVIKANYEVVPKKEKQIPQGEKEYV